MKDDSLYYLKHVNLIARKIHENIRMLNAFSQEDLYHYGVIGLMQLLEKSKKEGKPVNWKHFSLRIRGSILDALSSSGVHHRNEIRLNKPMKFVSFDPNVHDKESNDLETLINKSDDFKDIINAMQKLNVKQQIVLSLRFFCDKTFSSISDDVGYSLPTIHKIHDDGINNLRKLLLNETNY